MKIDDQSYLKHKLEWVKYRIKILDEIEARLAEMREIAITASAGVLDEFTNWKMNARLRELEQEVNELDGKGRNLWKD